MELNYSSKKSSNHSEGGRASLNISSFVRLVTVANAFDPLDDTGSKFADTPSDWRGPKVTSFSPGQELEVDVALFCPIL